jgi:hypothetical protein
MRVKYFRDGGGAEERTISALDAKSRVIMRQILNTIWQRSKAHKNGLFVRVVCPISQ